MFAKSNDIGILKNFAVSLNFQKKGIGTYIANNLVTKIAKDMDIKKLYLHGNDRGPFRSNHFWEKTKFKHIMSNEVKDKFYIDYFNHIVNNYSPDILCKESIFYLEL